MHVSMFLVLICTVKQIVLPVLELLSSRFCLYNHTLLATFTALKSVANVNSKNYKDLLQNTLQQRKGKMLH